MAPCYYDCESTIFAARDLAWYQASNSGNVSLKYLWPQRQHAGVGASDQHEAAVGAPLTAGVPLGERLTRDGCACCVLCDGHEAPRGEEHVLERDRRPLALGRDGDACVRRLHMGVGGVLLYLLWLRYTRYGPNLHVDVGGARAERWQIAPCWQLLITPLVISPRW